MKLTSEDRLFVLSGTGLSVESAIPSFQQQIEGFDAMTVLTLEGWKSDPLEVWKFQSKRRRDAAAAEPNAGHHALVELEKKLGDRLYLWTHAEDDLLERAGAARVRYIRGTLFESRCVQCEVPFADQAEHEQELPHCERCGSMVRPHHRLIGDPGDNISVVEEMQAQLEQATALLFVGVGDPVFPAGGLAEAARRKGMKMAYVHAEHHEDKTPMHRRWNSGKPLSLGLFDEVRQGRAKDILPGLVDWV